VDDRLPQLYMIRDNLRDLLPIVLPSTCCVRSFHEGDAPVWTRIIATSFEARPEKYDFNGIMRADPAFQPERIFFIEHNGTPVATASAWHKPERWGESGVVHYVGVSPGHRGMKLGYWVTLRALHRFVEEGRSRAVLETDDFRLPAVKTYLNLGFVPLVQHPSHPDRWRTVFAALGTPELIDRFRLRPE